MEEGQSTFLENLMSTYQHKMKEARNAYFSEVIINCGPNLKIIFKTVKSLINPCLLSPLDPALKKVDTFSIILPKQLRTYA